MALTADQITIAITVFDRRDFVEQAIESALNQTVPVRVMVVEDCGPDPALRKFIEERFGTRIQYHRNAHRRGLFDNWNACLELCPTRWLSILHDDDFLHPGFIAAMLELSARAPDRGFYFGQVTIIDSKGMQLAPPDFPSQARWREIDLVSFANADPVLFPGQLFRADYARDLKGFRPTSLFAGDWEMWFKLSAAHGNAQTNQPVAFVRAHSGSERGTRQIERSGKKFGLDNVQRKRNLAILRKMGHEVRFDRQPRDWPPIPSKLLIQNGAVFSPRILAYNVRLLLQSRAPHWRYALLQFGVRLLGAPFLKLLSQCWNYCETRAQSRIKNRTIA